jgi:hypothetical protein
MTAHILLIVVFLTNGVPLPNFFILPPGQACDSAVAVDYARRFIATSLADFAIQNPEEHGLFLCLDIPAPIEPGPGDPGALPLPEPEDMGEPLAAPQRDARL